MGDLCHRSSRFLRFQFLRGCEAEVQWPWRLGCDLTKLEAAFELREGLFGRVDWPMEEFAALMMLACVIGMLVVSGLFGEGVELMEGRLGVGGADSSILLIIHKEK